MTSMTQRDLEYINQFYKKDGEIQIIRIDKSERLCIISVPIFDGQEDETTPLKVITIPIDYNCDENDINLFRTPDMLDENDMDIIRDAIYNAYNL